MIDLIFKKIVLIAFLAVSFSPESDAGNSVKPGNAGEKTPKPKKEKKDKNAETRVHYKQRVVVKNEDGEYEQEEETVDISFSQLSDYSSKECKAVCREKTRESACDAQSPFRCKIKDKNDPEKTKEVVSKCWYDTSWDDGAVCVSKLFKLEKDYKDPKTGATYRRYTYEK
ncbi:MAG: hypothetical protein K2W94_01260 [Alphaproteobacteria bacterium]|nr:hypothetical protein [Alphaproteobacteria bacterium]